MADKDESCNPDAGMNGAAGDFDPPAADAELDTSGLRCPLPVLKARKKLAMLKHGQVLCVIADDPASIIDVPHFCAESGHILEAQSELYGQIRFWLRRKG
jgi:tRNA 2-thiouridine synthesizing protein A